MTYIIGIGGGSGSGKSSLSKILVDHFKEDVCLIQYDHYCLDQSKLPPSERANVNYDIPESYEGSLLAKHLIELKKGNPVDCPIYDFSTHSRTTDVVKIEPKKIILIEGILFFPIKEVFDQLDLKIYVDASEETRFRRRSKRDIIERGRSIESIKKQFFTTVAPMHNIYVEPYKELADFVFVNDKDEGLDVNQVQSIIEILRKA